MNSKLLVLLYLVAIVIANVSVAAFGPWVSIPNALIFISLDLTSRDSLHELWHGKHLWLKMAALIVTGSLLSALLNTGAARIAIASCAAFAAAGVVDTVAYALMHRWSKLAKMNGSNLFSGAVDSFVFPALAFGFPLLWPVMLGEFAAKVIGGAVWSWVLTRRMAETTVVRTMRTTGDSGGNGDEDGEAWG